MSGATRDEAPAELTLQVRLPLIWIGVLVGASLFLPSQIWNTLLVGFGGLFIIAYFWARQLAGGLSASRRLRFGWVSVGDRLEETFEIVNQGSLPAIWVELLDESNVPGYQAAVVRSVGPQHRDQWRRAATCQQRGQFHLGPWSIRSGDPFGIFRVTRQYATAEEIIIHPPIHGQLPIPLPAGDSSGRARARRRAWQATVNAAGVRDYRPRDPFQWIHWPTTARTGALHVREFDLDAAGDVWLLLDLEQAVQLGRGVDGTEEHAVLLAAALSARGLSQQRPVGLVAYGQHPQVVPPGLGEGQRWRLLRALALAQADGEIGLGRALHEFGRRVRRGAALVVITPSVSADWLPELASVQRQGVQAHVILLDRPSFGGAGATRGLQATVRRLGLSSDIVRQGEVGQPIEAEARRGHWEFIVTGTGKVVTVRSPTGERP